MHPICVDLRVAWTPFAEYGSLMHSDSNGIPQHCTHVPLVSRSHRQSLGKFLLEPASYALVQVLQRSIIIETSARTFDQQVSVFSTLRDECIYNLGSVCGLRDECNYNLAIGLQYELLKIEKSSRYTTETCLVYKILYSASGIP